MWKPLSNCRFIYRLRKSCSDLNARRFTMTVRVYKSFTFTRKEVACILIGNEPISKLLHRTTCSPGISANYYAFSPFDWVECIAARHGYDVYGIIDRSVLPDCTLFPGLWVSIIMSIDWHREESSPQKKNNSQNSDRLKNIRLINIWNNFWINIIYTN